MTDENRAQEGDEEELKTEGVFVVDWRREPPGLYVNAAAIEFGPDVVTVVYLDAGPSERRARVVEGKRFVTAVPVASIRMTPDSFLYVLQEMNSRWNKFVTETEAAGRGEGLPRFEVVPGKKP